MSKFRIRRNLLILAISSLGAMSYGDWTLICPGPTGRTSADYGVNRISNPLVGATFGGSGTITYNAGTDDPPGCFSAAVTANMRGRIGVGVGATGTVQTDQDNLMAITYGYASLGLPGTGGTFSYATLQTDGDSTLIGANAFSTFFRGASDTYMFGRTQNGDVQIEIRVDLVGDAARIDYLFTNTGTTTRAVGMRYGQHVALLKADGSSVGTPWTRRGSDGATYVTVPGFKPPRIAQRWNRATDPGNYPAFVDFNYSQGEGIGLRVENQASTATNDLNDLSGSQTSSDSFVLGNSSLLLGTPDGGDSNTFPDGIIPDNLYGGNVGYIQTWNPSGVPAGGSRRIVNYFRSPWSEASYGRPYSVVVDGPKVLNVNSADPTRFDNNPFTVRVWVDNNRGYSAIDQEMPLQDVKVDLTLPTGLVAVGSASKTINRIEARRMQFVDFTVRADDTAAGTYNYQVKVTPTPGPQKTITGSVNVVSQPRIALQANANLVTSPWNFEQPVWEAILGLSPESDFTAFSYDPVQKGYVPSTGPQRGYGQWIVSRSAQSLVLGGTPSAPTDFKPTQDGSGGAPLITIKQGWNLIANPYHVAIELGQIVGASNANPLSSFTFSQLVQQGLINGALAFWDTNNQSYSFIQKTTDRLEPQKGYWIRSNSAQDIVLRYPPVYMTNVRSNSAPSTWQQTSNQWRLQLAARNNAASDDQNFVGVANSVASARANLMFEPPIAPINDAISMSIEKMVNGEATRLAQTLSEVNGKQEFKVLVESNTAGPVTVTWPNLATIPKNVRARLVDTVTGETRDLRKFSGYTFQAEAKLTRELKVQLEPGISVAPVIGNVMVTRSGRSNGADASIRLTYTLTSDVTTTVRILSNTGREVMTVTRGRADKAGQNEVVWNLRDQAQRSVAPGTYRAEIIAEGNDGERTRKMYPFVITR